MLQNLEEILAPTFTDPPGGWFLNHYHCPCGCEWSDEWDCMCNDRCPECDSECEPYESEDV
jgi:hypothetical protein